MWIGAIIMFLSAISSSRLFGVVRAFQSSSSLYSRRTLLAVRSSQNLLFSSSADDESPKSATAASNEDPLNDYRNPKNRNDQVFSAISADGGIKVTACTVRNMVNDLMIQHTMTEVPTEVRVAAALQ